MINIQRQAGKAMVAWIIVIAVTTLITLRLVPVYIESGSVSSSLNGLKSAFSGEEVTVTKIRESLFKRFSINNVESVEPADITIKRERGIYVVTVDYEVRVPFFANIDFVVSFVKTAEVPAR